MRPLSLQLTLTASLCAAAVAGCVGYAPVPLEPSVLSQRLLANTIEPEAVQRQISAMAPGVAWDGRRLDRLTLLAAALAINPDLARGRAAAAAAAAEARAAAMAPGPTLTLTTEYAFNAPEASPWLFGIAGDLPLDTGARREARIDIAELTARIAFFDYADNAWTLRLQIRRALAERLLALKEMAIGDDLARINERQLAAMDHRIAVGAATFTEVARIRAQSQADLRRLADARARADSATLQLVAALGVPVKALDETALTWPDVDTPQKRAMPLPAPCSDAALFGRPDVARASLGYDQAEATLKNAVASQYPAVHLGPGYTWERGLRKVPFALGLSLPPLDFNHAAIAAAEARRREAGIALEASVAAAYAAVQQAQGGYQAAWDQLEHADRQNTIAVRLARQADSAIAAGAIDRIEWSTAQGGWLTALLDRITAVRNVRNAEAALEDAVRRPLDGPELAIAGGETSFEDSECIPPLPAQS